MSIPKIIHYCWLSNDPIPADYQNCMKSWQDTLLDYEFILWDTKRFDINSVIWVKQAFELQQYAYAADYIRLYAVYHYGGIYLDMDIEVIKPFDDLLSNDLILGYENHISETIEAGCFGGAKDHPFIKKCMCWFEHNDFVTSPALMTDLLEMDKYKRFSVIKPMSLPKIMADIKKEYFINENYFIYSNDYFTAKNIVTGVIEKTKNTFAIHHFSTNYLSKEQRNLRAIKQRFHVIFGENSKLVKIIWIMMNIFRRINDQGLFKSIKYYLKKYLFRKRSISR